MTLLAQATRDIEADGAVEVVLANGLVLALVPPPADKADDDCYSAKMCPQPNMCDFFRDVFPQKPKRKRRCVKNRPPLPRRVLPAMSRSREHRAAPRREGGGRSPPGDDGGGDGPPPSPPPPPHPKSRFGPRAEVGTRAPRVPEHGRARP